MKNKKCISLTLAALLMLTGCGAKGSDSAANADQAGKKVLTFGCQMYTDGIVNTVTDENGGMPCVMVSLRVCSSSTTAWK